MPLQVLTKDSVTIYVNAIMYYKVDMIWKNIDYNNI